MWTTLQRPTIPKNRTTIRRTIRRATTPDRTMMVVAIRSIFSWALILCLAPCTASAQAPVPEEPGLYAVFKTSMGVMVALLYDDKAPVTVGNFVALARGEKQTLDKRGKPAKRPYFDGLTFHRIIKGFMIQGGDVKGTGAGDCGVPTIADEFDKSLTFEYPGRLAMANTGRPHTGNCQFF